VLTSLPTSSCVPIGPIPPPARLQLEDIERLFKEVTDKWGTVDALVNNAVSASASTLHGSGLAFMQQHGERVLACARQQRGECWQAACQ